MGTRLAFAAACLALALQPLDANGRTGKAPSYPEHSITRQSADQSQALKAISNMMEGH